jgi:hypothetical protein
MKQQNEPRAVYAIARSIFDNWNAQYGDAPKRPSFITYGWPYLEAMLTLKTSSSKEFYGLEDAQMIVLRFLDNITHWRGDFAKAARQELKNRLEYDNPTKGR